MMFDVRFVKERHEPRKSPICRAIAPLADHPVTVDQSPVTLVSVFRFQRFSVSMKC
jgi:hypothetical protein